MKIIFLDTNLTYESIFNLSKEVTKNKLKLNINEHIENETTLTNQTETKELQDNLKKIKIKTNEMESGISIISKAEELITTKNQFKSFDLNNIEDRLNKLTPTINSQLKERIIQKT